MKLRNKKTGDIINIPTIINNKEYHSLVEFCEDYEDLDGYKPKEPLIKDPQIRKAVRAWAEANGASRAYIVDLGILRDESSGNEIKFNGEPFVGLVTSLKTITELCGEEQQ